VAVVLALATALVYGAADFAGGLAARQARALLVVGLSQAVGLLVALVLAGPLGGTPSRVDLTWGAAAGLTGFLAVALFYRALADGSMSVVAPVTAVCAAAVPVAAGLALGDRVGVAGLFGVALALIGVALVAADTAPGRGGSSRARTVGPALVAGTGFGFVFVLLHQTSPSSGLWPLVAARVASLVIAAVALTVGRTPLVVPRAAAGLIVAAGAGDMIANVLYLLAVRRGQLSVVGLLSSLYPVSTVVLAQLVLRERLVRVQAVGVAACAVAVVLIATS